MSLSFGKRHRKRQSSKRSTKRSRRGSRRGRSRRGSRRGRKSRRGSRRGRKSRRGNRRSRRFGAFGGGSPASLLEFQGPYGGPDVGGWGSGGVGVSMRRAR
jgi:hypothetical protein